MHKSESTLPVYRVKRQAQGRRLQLRVSPFGQIDVVAPHYVAEGEIAAFVMRKQPWLDARLQEVAQRRQQHPELFAPVPSQIQLPACGRDYRVSMEEHPANRVLNRPGGLCVRALDDFHAREALRRWLNREARVYLLPRLQQLSTTFGLTCSGVSIRAQRTRWGSCSAQAKISLNRNLMFLSTEQVDYLLIHELCHTVHLNHSPEYWQLVKKCSPAYKQLDKSLRYAIKQIPMWALPE